MYNPLTIPYKIICFLLIAFAAIPIYSNNFIIHSTNSNFNNSSVLPVFTALQNENFTNKIKSKLNNSPKAQSLLNELKNYLIVDSNFVNDNEIIPIRKNVIDTIPSANLSDKTQVNFQSIENQWHLKECNIPSTWKIATGKGIVVAVLDTGIDYYNDDFDGQLWINNAEDINHNGRYDAWLSTEERDGVFGDIDGIDNDGNGYVDDVIGFDFVNEMVPTFGDIKNIDGNPYDEHGHGTQVTSVIASKQNSKEVIGIAYDSKIMAVRTHNATGESGCIAIANGIIYAVLNGANVINLSSGETEDSPLIHTAIKFAAEMGVVVVCSAGNDGNTYPHYPSDYSEVISVGGINENQQRVFNYGDFLDISAPAVNIYVGNRNNTYRKNNGTSFSAPIVSAVCALLLSNNSNLSPDEIKTQIQLTAKSATGWNPQFGAGIIDAKKSLDFIGKANFKIEEPNQAQIIYVTKQDDISIKGTIAIPMFDNYVVRIKNCRENKNCEWDTLTDRQYLQVFSGELYKINFKEKSIPVGENIISVVCNLKSGKQIEERINVFIVDSNINLIKNTNSFTAYYNGNLVNIVNVKTNYLTSAKLFYKLDADTNLSFINSVEYITGNHIFILDNISSTHNYIAYIELKYGDIIQVLPMILNFTSPQISNVVSAKMTKQKYSIPVGYLYKKEATHVGRKCLISSLFDKNGSPEKIKYFSVNDSDTMFCVDSSNYNGICISRDNNCILSNYYGTIHWYNYSNNQNYELLTDEPLDSSFVGINLADIDGIAPKDIVYRDNKGNFYATFIDNNVFNKKKIFNYYDFIKQNSDIDLFSSHNRITNCIGNYYGDGKNYLATLTSNDAYLSIIELNTDTQILKEIIPITDHYHNELAHSNHNLNQDIFIQNGDIDGDGIDELIYMYYGKIDDTTDVLGKYEVWTIHIYKDKNGKMIEIASENIFGVRIGNYDNGLNTGDIDGDDVNELLICTYPNLYVFKYNKEHKKLVPYWYYPECNSNVAVVGDFNGNGKNEICFNNFTETIFFEFESNKSQSIFNFKGYAWNATSAFFMWESNANLSQEYELLLIETDSLLLDNNNYKKYLTSEKKIDISDLTSKTYYTAFVRMLGDTTLYNPITFFTNDATFPTSAEAINNKIIKVRFTDRVHLDNNSNGIELISENNSILSSTNLTIQNDSSVVVEFEKEIVNGNYQLKIPVFTDIYGNPTLTGELEVSVNVSFAPELFLTSLVYEPPLTLIVTFSESVDITALEKDNYFLYPKGSIENISFVDSQQVKIFLTENTEIYARGNDYLLTAHSNINAKSGNKMTTGVGNTLGFNVSKNNLDSVYVYPAPISLVKHKEAYIAHLPNNVSIEILNQFGKIIKSLEETDGNGGINWDLLDEQNNKCDIGIYFVRISIRNSNEQKLIKFAITK